MVFLNREIMNRRTMDRTIEKLSMIMTGGIHCNMDCILMAIVHAHRGIQFYIVTDTMQDTQIYGIT